MTFSSSGSLVIWATFTFETLFYCLWWKQRNLDPGLLSMSSYWNNLEPLTRIWLS